MENAVFDLRLTYCKAHSLPLQSYPAWGQSRLIIMLPCYMEWWTQSYNTG